MKMYRVSLLLRRLKVKDLFVEYERENRNYKKHNQIIVESQSGFEADIE